MRSALVGTLVFLLVGFVGGAGLVYFDLGPAQSVKSVLKLAGAVVGLKPLPYVLPDRRFFAYEMELDEQTSTQGTVKGQAIKHASYHLDGEITVLPGVFNPFEAEWTMLQLMQDNASLFKDAKVMEIGTGSGIISLYAARLGAKSVVSTDVNPLAIETITANARDLGYADIIEPRLVSRDDMSAYAVIGDDEQFDIIISNPPFALDLNAATNDAVVDTGELGFSIVRGLKKHLKPGGVVILLYDSLFYHQVMVKFAEYEGFDVVNNNPNGMYPWAAEALFNNYLGLLLKSEGLPPDAFAFSYHKDKALQLPYIRNGLLNPRELGFDPLFPPPSPDRYYPGMLVIRHKAN